MAVEQNGLDVGIYTHIDQEYTIVPSSRCESVIHRTVSFNAVSSVHRLMARGIVDRDNRNGEMAAHLKTLNVFVLEFSEIENVLLAEDVFTVICDRLRNTGLVSATSDDLIQKVKEAVLGELKHTAELVASQATAAEIESEFKTFDAKARGEIALVSAFGRVASLNVTPIYQANIKTIESILSHGDYDEALRIFGHKGLLAKAATILGLRNRDILADFVRNVMALPDGKDLRDAIKNHLPQLL